MEQKKLIRCCDKYFWCVNTRALSSGEDRRHDLRTDTFVQPNPNKRCLTMANCGGGLRDTASIYDGSARGSGHIQSTHAHQIMPSIQGCQTRHSAHTTQFLACFGPGGETFQTRSAFSETAVMKRGKCVTQTGWAYVLLLTPPPPMLLDEKELEKDEPPPAPPSIAI